MVLGVMLFLLAVRPIIAAELLSPKTMQFMGAFKLPQTACGDSTGFSTGCLAVRMIDGKAHVFSDTHVETGGLVYEAEVPMLAFQPPYATAKVVKTWGDIYHSKKLNAAGEPYPLDGNVPTTNLRWEGNTKSLVWSYGEKYNNDNKSAPTFGATALESGEVAGPLRLAVPNLWQRGGTLEIPPAFADKYLQGNRLGVGFGGYYSIFEGGSYGPALTVDKTTLLAYPDPHRCVRDANYHHAKSGDWVGTDPKNGIGTWNATDEIGGENHGAGAVWIDMPEVQGVAFFVSLGTGRIAYEEGGVQCQGRSNALYVYDQSELAKVARGQLKPWQPKPAVYPLPNPAKELAGRVASAAWDESTKMLYVCFTEAYQGDVEFFPVVVAYRIGPLKESPSPPDVAAQEGNVTFSAFDWATISQAADKQRIAPGEFVRRAAMKAAKK